MRDPEFRRLIFTRFAAQWGDGVFRAGLAGAILFNPERETDPLAIAAGFAALLLPYSVIGPFAGALLDRWDRRRVLVFANLLRGVAVLAAAAAVGLGASGLSLFTLALCAEGITRFIGSGLSASLPHVVPTSSVVTANAFATTAGSLVALVGGGCAIGLRGLFGADNVGSAYATAFAVFGTLASAAIARRFAPGLLGPSTVDEPASVALAVGRGFSDGARAALHAPSVTAGFVALFAHRASYGISLLVTLLLMRNSFTSHGFLRAGLPGIGQVAALAGAGIFVGGLVTARLIATFGRLRVVLGSLLLAAAAQAGLGLPMEISTVLLASFVITCAGQVLKLSVDSSIQLDVGDESRGRVFALYDTLFNIVQVAAVAVAAALVRVDGRSTGLLLSATVMYLIGALGYLFAVRRNSIG
ncbi:MFS transporter [Amycolatopsis sp.]|uniref:MFS transporter n=1 Tax=Amycolatopsis sp. TaxID=37632 RepID=UPI002E00118D|nr:MFS transporter [Amycolatopsis sp.]